MYKSFEHVLLPRVLRLLQVVLVNAETNCDLRPCVAGTVTLKQCSRVHQIMPFS